MVLKIDTCMQETTYMSFRLAYVTTEWFPRQFSINIARAIRYSWKWIAADEDEWLTTTGTQRWEP